MPNCSAVFTNVHQCHQYLMAERGGFEPPVDLRPHNLSKVAPSTTRTPLQSFSFACSSGLTSGARSGTRTRTYSRTADFESAAAAITPPWPPWMERAKGIEPSSRAWKAHALPLSYARFFQTNNRKYIKKGGPSARAAGDCQKLHEMIQF